MTSNRLILSGIAALAAASLAPAQWSQATPPASPTTREMPAMGFDAGRGEVVLFGGGGLFSFYNDTWVYSNGTWAMRTPQTRPGGRSMCELVYDVARNVSVLYGGNAGGGPWGGPANDETWLWNGTDWAQASPATTPGGLTMYGAAYDLQRSKVVIYGGLNDSGSVIAMADTWEWDGTNWAQITTAASPGPRQDVAMCFHAGLGKVVMFGGVDPQVGGFGDTWTYDGTNWARLTIAGTTPSARTRSKMVYDPTRNVCVMYGGMDPMTGQAINETWEFDGTSWTQITSPANPSTRNVPALTMDTVRGTAVLWGGLDANYNALTDTWEFGATFRPYGAGCPGAVGTPILTWGSMPRINGTVRADVRNANPSSTSAWMEFGFSRNLWGATPLPADLTFIGMPGCSAWASGDVAMPFTLAGGTGSWSLTVPNDAGLYGAPFYLQALIVENGANTMGIITTNAGECVIGR